MAGVPYPMHNSLITFREPFPRVEYSPYKKLYIRAEVNGVEQEIRIDSNQQVKVIRELIRQDGKLLNAKVRCVNGKFEIFAHSPQSDFFELVR